MRVHFNVFSSEGSRKLYRKLKMVCCCLNSPMSAKMSFSGTGPYGVRVDVVFSLLNLAKKLSPICVGEEGVAREHSEGRSALPTGDF